MTLAICTRPEHAGMPVAECENVRLTRRRFTPVCLCGHPKAVHEHWRTALDCGMCDCLHCETARSIRARVSSYATAAGIALFVVAFWGAVAPGSCGHLSAPSAGAEGSPERMTVTSCSLAQGGRY